jgi:hypothetical protein
MVTGPLVESFLDDGARVLEKLRASGFDVSAAAWVQTTDEKWSLYVVSKTVDEQGVIAAYGASSAALGKVSDERAAASKLTLVRLDTRFGRSLVEIQRRYCGLPPVHFQLLRIGDVTALEAYVYPPKCPPSP